VRELLAGERSHGEEASGFALQLSVLLRTKSFRLEHRTWLDRLLDEEPCLT
jgi:hypothetical protein